MMGGCIEFDRRCGGGEEARCVVGDRGAAVNDEKTWR